MAEVNTNPVEQSTDTTTQQSAENTSNGAAEVGTQQNDTTMTMQELQNRMQDLLTENAKLKRAKDKANSEANGWKDKYNATLSATERASQEKAEQAARDA